MKAAPSSLKRKKRRRERHIGMTISAWRKIRNKMQEEFAKETKIPLRTLSRIETGERDPKPHELKAIAEELKVPIEVLERLDEGLFFHSFNNNQEGGDYHVLNVGTSDKQLYEKVIADLQQDKADLKADLKDERTEKEVLRAENLRLQLKESALQSEIKVLREELKKLQSDLKEKLSEL